MANTTKSTNLFNPKLRQELFSKVKGHSSLALLSEQKPISFVGNDVMTFNLDGEVSIVAEGTAKPAGGATYKPVTMSPIKVVYQHRATDEFMNMSEEEKLPIIEELSDAFAKKIARGLDLMAMHGINPATKLEAESIGTNCFDKAVGVSKIDYVAANADDNLSDAIVKVQEAEQEVTGLALAPTFAQAMGKIKDGKSIVYPEFKFGANPERFAGHLCDVNTTVNFNAPTNKVEGYVGNFAEAFRWGYSDYMPLEVIEYGDPDGQGDLKANNAIVLRVEAYIGWGILAPEAFARIETAL